MSIRPARRDDLAAVVDLYRRYERQVHGEPDTDPDDVLLDWNTPGFDFAASTLLAEDAGDVVGYAVVVEEYADTVVEPDGLRDGLREQLLDWVEQHPGDLEHFAQDGDAALNALLERRAWTPARRFWRMRRELAGELPEPVWPDGVSVRPYDRPADDRPVYELITASFREIGGQVERTFEQWSQSVLETDRFDPELYLVAVADGQVVGAAVVHRLGEQGFVRQLAVAPAQRGRGLGLALLCECFRRHAARGLQATVLGVDAANPTGALRLYESAGMSVNERFTRWDRPAPSAST